MSGVPQALEGKGVLYLNSWLSDLHIVQIKLNVPILVCRSQMQNETDSLSRRGFGETSGIILSWHPTNEFPKLFIFLGPCGF